MLFNDSLSILPTAKSNTTAASDLDIRLKGLPLKNVKLPFLCDSPIKNNFLFAGNEVDLRKTFSHHDNTHIVTICIRQKIVRCVVFVYENHLEGYYFNYLTISR